MHLQFEKAFQKLISLSHDFLYFSKPPASLLKGREYGEHTFHAYFFNSPPGLLQHLYSDMSDYLICNDEPEPENSVGKTLFTLEKQVDYHDHITIAFTYEGLHRFCKEGIFYLSEDSSRFFTPSERIELLNRILMENESGNRNFLLINRQHFHPNPAFSFFSNEKTALFSLSEQDCLKTCIIEEAGICLSIKDFFENAVFLNCLMSVETTNQEIISAMQEIPSY